MMGGAGFGMAGFGWIFMILFWVLVIVAVVYAVRYFLDRGRSSDTVEGDRAEEILRKRFASGEISREEFNERMKVLKG